MIRFFRSFFKTLLPVFVVFQLLTPAVFAQSFSDIFNLNNSPVNYDSPYQIGRGFKEADSIDSCLARKEFYYNEVHDIWVEGLARCKYNSKRVLSKATAQGVSIEPVDEQACSGKREGQILLQGTPSESEARRWSERCSYLGTVGGAGPIQNQNQNLNTTGFQQYFSTTNTGTGAPRVVSPTTGSTPTGATTAPPTRQQVISSLVNDETYKLASPAEKQAMINERLNSTSTNYQPVYSGSGVQVPGENLIPQGISRRRSLSELIIFYTNVTLPYVSVISVLAFVAAGIFYILSFTNEELSGKAKTMMTYVVIGIIIIFSAYTIVNTLLSFITFE